MGKVENQETTNSWKEENLIDIAAPSYITLNVAIKNKDSFKKIINNIKKVNSVDSFLIESFEKFIIISIYKKNLHNFFYNLLIVNFNILNGKLNLCLKLLACHQKKK